MSDENDWNKNLIKEFRINDGKVGGHFTGKTLLLLHTKGAKSGQERVTPIAYIGDGDRLAIIASNDGAPNHPAWYHNLLADPLVTVEVGINTFQVHATISQEPERTCLFDKMAEMMPIFDKYRREATRMIPVIVLTPM